MLSGNPTPSSSYAACQTLTSTTTVSQKSFWLNGCVRPYPARQIRRRPTGSLTEGMNRMKATLLSILEPTDDGIIQQLSRKSIREGEERLLYAMLECAIEDYQKYATATDRKGQELFQQAEEWFFETDSSSEFSFENLCDYLQLNPSYVRKGLLKWKKEKRCSQAGQRLAS